MPQPKSRYGARLNLVAVFQINMPVMPDEPAGDHRKQPFQLLSIERDCYRVLQLAILVRNENDLFFSFKSRWSLIFFPSRFGIIEARFCEASGWRPPNGNSAVK
jgi:hypothetical protein